MAETYGVKVKLQFQTNKSDLRGQLQGLLDGAVQNNPLTIKNFKVSAPGLRKALNAGFKEANTPLTLSNIKLNLSSEALSGLQTQLNAKELTLTIKEIKADQAVNNLRTQLVRMLSGLQISGVKDFLGGEEITEQGKALESFVGNLERLKAMRTALSKSGTQLLAFGNDNSTAELQRALTLYKELTDQVSRGIEARGNWDNVDGLQEELRTLTTLIATHKAYLDSLKQEAAAREKNAAATNSANLRELQKMETALEKINTKGFNLDIDQSKIDVLTEKYNRLYEAIQKAMNTSSMRNNGHSIQELHQGVQALNQYVDALQAEANANNASLASSKQLLSLRSQINSWLQKNTKATQANRTQLQNWADELSLGNVSTARYTEIANGVKQIDLQTRQAGLSGKTFFDTFKAGLEKFGGWSLVTRSLTMVYNTLKRMVSAVIELNSAMTELRRVTDLTDAGYKRFMQTASATAKTIGASVKDTITATADFARLGYSVEEAIHLATAALTYKNIGDGIEDISTATESLISTMKAFGIEAESSMYVVDMFNKVGNEFAISSKGIGDALQRSAAALAEGGNTIQESIAIITAANEIIQDPDVIGTAMKTLTMYLRAAKTEAEDAGIATDGMASSVSTLRNDLLELTGQRVDIMVDEDTFKSTYQIMKELADIWDQLTDTTRSNVLNLIGGKRNANTFSALLSNFDQAAEAMEAAMGAAGSATLENEKYLESIEGRVNLLKASFEELSASVVNSGLIKFFVSALNVVVDFATWLDKIGLLLPTIAIGGAFVSLASQIQKAQDAAKSTFSILQAYANASTFSDDDLVKLRNAFSGLTDIQKLQALQTLQNSEVFGQLSDATKQVIIEMLSLNAATDVSSGKFASLKNMFATLPKLLSGSGKGLKGVGTVLSTVWKSMGAFSKISLVLSAVNFAYTNITNAIDKHNQKQEEAISKANEFVSIYQNEIKSITASQKTLRELGEEYETLAQGVDENGNAISLTEAEYKRYLDVVAQIVDISPEVVAKYNDEQQAVLLYADAIEIAINKQEELARAQRDTLLAQGKEIFDDMSSIYTSGIRKLQKSMASFIPETLFQGSLKGFNPSGNGYYDRSDALQKAFNLVGINFDVDDLWGDMGFRGSDSLPYDTLSEIIKNRNEILTSLQNSGAYASEEIANLTVEFLKLEQQLTSIDNIELRQIEYLEAYSRNQDWFSNLTPESIDEFRAGLYSINDPLKTYADNMSAASEYGRQFALGLTTQGASAAFAAMAESVRLGNTALETYESAVSSFLTDLVSSGQIGDAAALALHSYYLSLAQATAVTSEAGVEVEETTEKVRTLTDAIGEYNTAVSLMENLRSGDTLSVLENIMSLVASGAHINMSDFFDEQGLKSADDILTSITNTLLQNLEELAAKQGITWDGAWTIALKEQLANAGVEVEKQTTAYERLTQAAIKANSAIVSAPAQGDLVPLTKEAYDELIAIDARYASAVQYQNGVLTLNRDAYAAVTQQILQNTKAQAAAEIQAIVTGDKYRDLTSRIGTLDEAEQKQLDSLNAEIMGYSVLISELENATSAYQRFVNASTQTDSSRYSAAENARKVIEDTLYNAESDIFGKIGREQYVAAIDFLIDPNVEVGTDEFDAALATIDRYLEEGTAGVRNFYNDLIQHGFIDGNGVLSASMTDMASTLGVSMEFLRSMFDELNMYQDEDHKVKIECDTGEVESEALSAEEQLAALQAAATSLNETLDIDHTVTINTDPANTNLGTVSSNLTSIINKLNSLSGRRVTTYVHTVRTSSTGDNGAASAGGTKSAAGGRTLVGELGMETVVDPNTGSWYTVGRGGAEFIDLPRGAIVFNADQTKRLFQMGRIGSRGEERGKAMAAGGLVGSIAGSLPGATSPFFQMVAAGVTGVIPSIVSGVVSGITETAHGKPVLPPAGTDNDDKKNDYKPSAPDPTKKIEELSSAYEDFMKYMAHLIRHQEHLYEVAENALDFPGMESSLTEQARIYREMMSEAQSTVNDMIAAGATDRDEALQKVEESYWSAYSSLHDILDQINALYVDALNAKIDGVQSGYETFSTMLDEMSKDGKISVDTFQELVANGLEYLNYLELVDGQYVINQEALEKMIAAEKEQLAIEQALAYISQIRQALSDDDPEKVANLINLTNQISNSTWDLVYANAALLKTMGLTDDEYASIIHNIDMMKSLTGQVNTSLDDGYAAYESQQDALDKILDYTKQLIQYETEEKIKAIEDEIDAYEELVNLRKEALKTAKDEADYSSDVADRTKEIAALESRIVQLSLDDSREAQAERAALEEELSKLQGDLADVQGDHAYEVQIAALDNDAESYRKSREEEIAALEASISSEEKLYQAALQRIDSSWDTLYSELIAWNTEAGSSLNSEITSNWNLALEAAKRYGSYVDAVVARTGNPMVIRSVETRKLPVAHDGGVISVNGIKPNEVITVLEDGEEVITKKQRAGLYRIVDFAKELSNRLGTAIKEIALPFRPMTPALADVEGVHGTVVSNQNSMNFSPEITVQITHSGDMSDSDARSYGRQIGNIAMKEMQNAFERRGISGIFGGNLRQ